MDDYSKFLMGKVPEAQKSGFHLDLEEISPMCFPHQRDTIAWAFMGGRRAIFAQYGLGKTIMQLELGRLAVNKLGGKGLIVCPLGVRQEFTQDAKKLTEYAQANGLPLDVWGIDLEYVTTTEQALNSKAKLCITNYERVRDGGIDPSVFCFASLDEASVLRGYGTLTYQEFLVKFPQTAMRYVCTATPAPNRFKELIHYAGFLGIMDTGEALTRFFQRDSEKAGNLTLYPHKEKEFWLWMTTWALFLTKPSDVGYDDAGYDLPELKVHYHRINTQALKRPARKRRDNEPDPLFADAAISLQYAAVEKRISIPVRVQKALEIANKEPEKHFVFWHTLESERHELEKTVNGSKSIYGTQDTELREELTLGFARGDYKYLNTKPEISGSGCNFQHHCADCVFVGIDYRANDFMQAIHRFHRFGQTKPVNVHIIYTDTEEAVLEALKLKWENHNQLVKNMTDLVKQYGLAKEAISTALGRNMGLPRYEERGEGWTFVNNDCVLECAQMESDSVDLIHTSIPFGNHYEYSPSYNDFGHNKGNAEFFEQMDHLTPNLLRILKPGRVAAIHVKDRILFGNVTGMGMPTLDPFHALTIGHYMKHGFAFFGMVTIETDVVRENNQTYRLGWTEQCKDGSKMGVGCPEYLLLFRKLPTDRSNAYADEPVGKSKETYTRAQWQIDARAKWNSSGDRLIDSEELANADLSNLGKSFKDYMKRHIYDYADHISLAMAMDKAGRLPATFELFQVPARNQERVWSDISRMRTLNSEQSRKNLQNHVCLARDSMVLTKESGYKPIQDVNVGDMVLTHKGRWKLVEVVRCTGVRPVVTLRAQGVPGLVLTPDHNVWTRLVPSNAWSKAHSRKAAKKAVPAWIEAKDTLGSYVNQRVPEAKHVHISNIELGLIGRWLADGHIDAHGSYMVSIGNAKLDAFKRFAGIHYGGESQREAMQVRLVKLSQACKHLLAKCGKGAANKQIPTELLGISQEQAKVLLTGYLSGDGHLVPGRNRYMATTVSKSLAFGLSMLAQVAYGAIASVTLGRAPGETTIQGRKVSTKQEYVVSFDVPKSTRKNGLPFIEEDGAWKKVRALEDSGEKETWCIRVEEDASFTAEGCIVKNCPLQFDIVDRVINRFSNPGDLVFDPFGGISTVPYRAKKLGRRGYGVELNPDYWRDGLEYLRSTDRKEEIPTLFDMLEIK